MACWLAHWRGHWILIVHESWTKQAEWSRISLQSVDDQNVKSDVKVHVALECFVFQIWKDSMHETVAKRSFFSFDNETHALGKKWLPSFPSSWICFSFAEFFLSEQRAHLIWCSSAIFFSKAIWKSEACVKSNAMKKHSGQCGQHVLCCFVLEKLLWTS